MSHKLDHIVIGVADLDRAMQQYRDLGFTVVYGGKHAAGNTHNALICLQDGTYIELLAPTGDLPASGALNFGGLLDRGQGLIGFALRSDDLEVEAERMRQQGIAIGEIITGGRTRADGKRLEWKIGRVGDSYAPFYIEDVTPRELRVSNDPAVTTQANGISGIERVDMDSGTVYVQSDKALMIEVVEGEKPVRFVVM
ncbi:MAG: VOC family protein [Anaerolineae bacterium]|nr:VOC family protein [Anaerolineae bacterium]